MDLHLHFLSFSHGVMLHEEFCVFPVVLFYPYNYKVEEDEVGGTCGTNGGEEERV
jgi:hypothetical protein